MNTLLQRAGPGLFDVFVLLAFVAVALLAEGLYLLWNSYHGPEAQRMARRLQALSAGGGLGATTILRAPPPSPMPALDRWFVRLPRVPALDRLLLESGAGLGAPTFLALSVLSAGAVGTLLAWASHLPWPFVALAAGLGGSVPWMVLARRRELRMRRIERQLPDALDLMTRALRAGHAFQSCVRMVGEELPSPLGAEFRITHDEVNFGVPIQQALLNLATRVPSLDLRYFVVAVSIQRETGGNLTEMLANLSRLVRERMQLIGKVRVLSAEGRMSAWILTALPFAVAGGLYLIDRPFISTLWTDPVGHKLVGLALLLMVLGMLWMRRLVRIHV